MLSALAATQKKNTVTNLKVILSAVPMHKDMYNQHL
jgi:hypothetical protein